VPVRLAYESLSSENSVCFVGGPVVERSSSVWNLVRAVLASPEQASPSRLAERLKQYCALAWLCLLLGFSSMDARAQVNVLTRGYDASSTGANLQETTLSCSPFPQMARSMPNRCMWPTSQSPAASITSFT
jgi:hypothetical protein